LINCLNVYLLACLYMIILGLDPGLATTGYALLKKERSILLALEWGVIETSKSDNLPKRLHTLASDLAKLIKKFRPQIAVVESLFVAKNLKTAINVSHARGVIALTLHQQNVRMLELTPLQVKSRIAGYGSASKKQVQYMVKALLNLRRTPKPDDAADALALAICAT